jgi:hypothetical protein
MVMVLLSASVENFSVSRMQFVFFIKCLTAFVYLVEMPFCPFKNALLYPLTKVPVFKMPFFKREF